MHEALREPSRRLSAASFLTISLLPACFGGFDEPLRDSPQAQRQRRQTGRAGPADAGALSDAKRAKDAEPKQSYREAWALICKAEQLSGADPSKSRSERGDIVASWIVENVSNKKARFWFINFGKIKKQLRRQAFVAEASAAGQSKCDLVDLLFAPPAPPSDAGPG